MIHEKIRSWDQILFSYVRKSVREWVWWLFCFSGLEGFYILLFAGHRLSSHWPPHCVCTLWRYRKLRGSNPATGTCLRAVWLVHTHDHSFPHITHHANPLITYPTQSIRVISFCEYVICLFFFSLSFHGVRWAERPLRQGRFSGWPFVC